VINLTKASDGPITFTIAGKEGSLFGGLDGDLNKLFDREMAASTAAILNRLRTTYLAEQDPAGAPWIPSRSGIARRKRGGTGTLFDSGRLFRSIQLATLPNLGEASIFTDVPYANKHNLGTDGMVKREFLAITPEHASMALSIFEKKVQEIISAQN